MTQQLTRYDHKEISWYAMSAAGKMPYVMEILRQLNIYCWAPFYNNPAADASLMPLILFRATQLQVYQLHNDWTFPAYIYRQLGAERWTPCTLDNMQVRRFKSIRDMDNGSYRYFADEKKILEKGKPVRVIDGMFKGMEGYVCRIKGNTSLYVNIPGICVVSIAYIPKAFLEGFEELKEKQAFESATAAQKETLILQLSDKYNTPPYSTLPPDELLARITEECRQYGLSPQDLYINRSDNSQCP